MMIHIERLDGDKIISHDGLVFEGGQENRAIKKLMKLEAITGHPHKIVRK